MNITNVFIKNNLYDTYLVYHFSRNDKLLGEGELSVDEESLSVV
ncbi:MAG: hypothetical protein HNEKOMLI_00910 [Sodalis sp. Psp]|nr:hypothetical protein [Sodalis sp. Psp]MCR3757368.1 hypothetical protein [Sodalis sp. Ppy]